MQYDLEVLPYKRIKKEKNRSVSQKNNLKILRDYMIIISSCFLISRVKLINGMAPFGIAILVSLSLHLDKKNFLVASLGSIIGYITLTTNIAYISRYFLSISSIAAINYIFRKDEKIKKIISIFLILILEYVFISLFIEKTRFSISVFYAFMEGICLIPLYYIINQGIICLKNVSSKNIFSNEEIISMGILISFILAGTWGIHIKHISIMNILGLLFINIIGFITGSSIGGTTGVALGIIIGMSSNDMPIFISVFGICGLISGIFRDTGKYFTSIAFSITFFIIQMYLGTNTSFLGIEVIISLVIFLAIPSKLYKKLALDFNFEEKKEDLSESYINKIKNIYIEKINNFSELLSNIAFTLEGLVDNDKLNLKDKSSALIENLADRVCSGCNMKTTCWKREIHYTYSAFSELIENYQYNNYNMPFEIERKCINRTSLIKNTEDIVTKYIIKEMKRKSLLEGRQILSNQIKNMAITVQGISKEMDSNMHINIILENKIRRILDKSKVKYSNLLCIIDERGRSLIKLSTPACGGTKKCSKEILAYINEAVGEPMCITTDECCIDRNTENCTINFEEIPKFHVKSYVAKKCKDGEKCNGDSYSYSKLKDGTYMSIISDGMGSGPQAGRESEAAVNLINEFCKAGFNKLTAINTINSIMSMKFMEDEKFSTLDICDIDLYSGKTQFIKVGAVDSFIKRGNKINVIKSKSLPIGILDKVDAEIDNKELNNGDIIVMVSDGVLDYNDSNLIKNNWIIEYLKNLENNNPKDIACELLNEAIKINDYKIKDDMTVLVSKVYEVY